MFARADLPAQESAENHKLHRFWYQADGANALRFFSRTRARRPRHENCDCAHSDDQAETILLRIFAAQAFAAWGHSSADYFQI